MTKILMTVVVVAVLATPLGAAGQVDHLRPSEKATVALELSKPFIGDLGLSWSSSLIRARLLAPMGRKTHFMVDWGLSHAGIDGTTSTTLSNPELGIVFSTDASVPRGFISVVLPLAQEFGDDDFATLTGLLSDLEHPERFISELWSVNAGLTPSTRVGSTTSLDFLVAGSVKIPKSDGDTELFGRYGFGVSNETDLVRFYAQLTGLAILSEGGLSFGDRTLHHLSAGVDGLSGGPGFFVRVPLDDNVGGLDVIVGLTFTF